MNSATQNVRGDQRGGGHEPLELQPLIAHGAAEPDEDRTERPHYRDHEGKSRYDEGNFRQGRDRTIPRREEICERARPVLGSQDHRAQREQDQDSPGEPSQRSPALRWEMSGREQEEQEGQKTHGDRLHPVGEPDRCLPTRERPAIRQQGMKSVRPREGGDSQQESGRQEQPADRVSAASGNDHRADDRSCDVHGDVEDARDAPRVGDQRQRQVAIDEPEDEPRDHQRDRREPDDPGQPTSCPGRQQRTLPRDSLPVEGSAASPFLPEVKHGVGVAPDSWEKQLTRGLNLTRRFPQGRLGTRMQLD
jgi:hypothetical protein